MIVSDNVVYKSVLKDRKLRDYVDKINRRLKVPRIMVITLEVDDENLMSFMSVKELYAQLERGHVLSVIGIADNKKEAEKMVGYICQNIMDTYGEINKQILYKEYHIHEKIN